MSEMNSKLSQERVGEQHPKSVEPEDTEENIPYGEYIAAKNRLALRNAENDKLEAQLNEEFAKTHLLTLAEKNSDEWTEMTHNATRGFINQRCVHYAFRQCFGWLLQLWYSKEDIREGVEAVIEANPLEKFLDWNVRKNDALVGGKNGGDKKDENEDTLTGHAEEDDVKKGMN